MFSLIINLGSLLQHTNSFPTSPQALQNFMNLDPPSNAELQELQFEVPYIS